MPSTPSQRALWRLQRQMKTNQPLKQSDLELLEETPAEVTEYLQKSQQSSQPAPAENPTTPVVNQIPVFTEDQGSKGTLNVGPQPARTLTKQEKEWKSFYEIRLGPLVVFILAISFRNMERARFYAPTPDECKAAAIPLAKATVFVENKFKVPSWVHEVASECDDYITLGIVCFAYLERIGVMSKFQDTIYPTNARRNDSEVNAGLNGHTVPVQQSSGDGEYVPYGIGLQYSPDL